MDRETATNALKEAIIAEVASDVLHMKSDVAELKPLINQLKESIPQSFDLLKSGMIETLDIVNKEIVDAGGARVEFVKGQLHSYIEQAFAKALESNSKEIEELQAKFSKQNALAIQHLKAQYEEVSTGMNNVLANAKKSSLPSWAIVTIPLVILLTVVCGGAVCWQLASYKEAVYMQAFLDQVSNQSEKPSNPSKPK